MPLRQCIDCRQANAKKQRLFRDTPSGKASQKKTQALPNTVMLKKKHNNSEKHRSSQRKRMAEKRQDPVQWLLMKIQQKTATMATGIQKSSNTVKKYTEFKSANDLMSHMESLFEAGMTTTNHGKLKGHWHVGHRIARCMYTGSTSDMKKCWSKANVFPQWAVDNWRAGVKLPPDDVLIEMRPYWPDSWTHLPTPMQRKVLETRGTNKQRVWRLTKK